MLLKNRCIRKLKVFGFSLVLVACAERPVYEPAPRTGTSTSGQQKSSTEKTGAGETDDKTADASNTPPAADAPAPAVNPTPTPTPAPPAAAPAQPVGVAATGRTLITANCLAVGCHGSTQMNAKDEAMLLMGNAIMNHAAALKTAFFTKPLAGAAPNNFSHVLEYLKVNAPIMGPNIP